MITARKPGDNALRPMLRGFGASAAQSINYAVRNIAHGLQGFGSTRFPQSSRRVVNWAGPQVPLSFRPFFIQANHFAIHGLTSRKPSLVEAKEIELAHVKYCDVKNKGITS